MSWSTASKNDGSSRSSSLSIVPEHCRAMLDLGDGSVPQDVDMKLGMQASHWSLMCGREGGQRGAGAAFAAVPLRRRQHLHAPGEGVHIIARQCFTAIGDTRCRP